MKQRKRYLRGTPSKPAVTLLLAALLLPAVSQAQPWALVLPVEMNLAAYLLIGFLLVLSIVQFFLYQQRYRVTRQELTDLTEELSTTRSRLTDTAGQLDTEQKEHKTTAERYTRILFDAQAGMFQIDRSGKCIYLNAAMQELSGLYPKKALKEGLESAIHPEDKKEFIKAWDAFTADDKAAFEHCFRFQTSRTKETHVLCRAAKMRDAHNDVESYIGWAADITQMHEEVRRQQAETERFEHFVSETVEGFYKLVPDTPIRLNANPEKIAEKILRHMELRDCNDTFAAMYGSTPDKLLGKSIGDLTDGCGPFRTAEQVQEFAAADCQVIDLESVRRDSNGNRIHLMHNAVGMIEDNQLVGIWGYQRNVSRQKREQTELSNKIEFLQRILDALPADVQVKDTRCRYLYASKILAQRTGICQEEWIGKTIFEILPATPRTHDQPAIEAMKSGSLLRSECRFDANDRQGWMENHQVPLISEEGLVEGVVSLSLDITARKKGEEEALQRNQELQAALAHTQQHLIDSRSEQAQTAADLAAAQDRAQALHAERNDALAYFREKLAEQRTTEEKLRRTEQSLLTRQQQLEEQLSRRIQDLDKETCKRRKWEELLQIKEEELRRLEENTAQLEEYYAQETARRGNAETSLRETQANLTAARTQAAETESGLLQQIEQLQADFQAELQAEKSSRKQAEKKLERTQEFLESTQEQVRNMTDQHAHELELEVAAHKEAAEKLVGCMKEFDALRLNFSQRLDDETKAIKHELAQKQIREKALRQNEKDLEKRIRQLESTLQQKTKAHAEQIQAREGVETAKNQLEQEMKKLTQRQQELVENETKQLHLTISEIRLEEVKHRKRAAELENAKEELEEQLRVQEDLVEKARREQQQLAAALQQSETELKQLTGEQSKQVGRETEALQEQLQALEQAGREMKLKMDALNVEKKEVEKNLETRSRELADAAGKYRKMVDAYKTLKAQQLEDTEGRKSAMAEKTGELKAELKRLQRSEQMLKMRESELQSRIKGQQDECGKLNHTLKEETNRRYDAEQKLRELEVTLQAALDQADRQLLEQTACLKDEAEQAKQHEAALATELKLAEATVKNRDAALARIREERQAVQEQLQQTENRLIETKHGHQAELKKTLAEVQEVSRKNSRLVDELNDMIQTALDPVVETALLLEKSGGLSDDQKRRLSDANEKCRRLIDTMNYRADLTQLNAGDDELLEKECDLHVVMTDIDQAFTRRVDLNDLFLAVSFAQYQASNNIPKRVIADEEKLRKTLSILVGYALSKTSRGRLGLHATRESSDSETTSISFELTFTPDEAEDELLFGIFNAETEGVIDLKHGLTLARRYIKLLGGMAELDHRDAGMTALTVTLPFKRTDSEIIIPKGDDQSKAGAA